MRTARLAMSVVLMPLLTKKDGENPALYLPYFVLAFTRSAIVYRKRHALVPLSHDTQIFAGKVLRRAKEIRHDAVFPAEYSSNFQKQQETP